jgi:hypothetical protein
MMIRAWDTRVKPRIIQGVRLLLAAAFGFEALLGAETLARFVTVAPTYDSTVWVMTALRGLVTLGQGISAMLLWRGAPPAALCGRVVALTSAVLLTLEIGARLAPSSLQPGTREPVMAAYWAYAVFMAWALGRVGVQK